MLNSEEENNRVLLSLLLTIILGAIDNLGSPEPFFTIHSIHTIVFLFSGILAACRYFIHFQVDFLNAEVDVSYIVFIRVLLRGSVFFFMCGVALLVVDYGGLTTSPFAVLLTMTPLYLITKSNPDHERKLFLYRVRLHFKTRKVLSKNVYKYINRKKIRRYFKILTIEGILINCVFWSLIIVEICMFSFLNTPYLTQFCPWEIAKVFPELNKNTLEMTSSVWHSVVTYMSFSIAMVVAILSTSTPRELKAFFERRFSANN